MPEIIQQVGTLLLGAVPTILLFIVLVLAYQFLVQGPLTATLKQRRARTEGAIEDAHKAIAQAEARAAEYADKLRQRLPCSAKLRLPASCCASHGGMTNESPRHHFIALMPKNIL